MEAVVWPAPTTRTYSSGPPEDIAAVYPDYKLETNLNIIALLVIGLSASESDTSSTASGQ